MKVIRLTVLTFLGGLLPTVSVGQTIVWTDANARRIQRKDVNGGEVQTIVQFQSPQAPSRIHYDPITAKLYYYLSGTPSSFQRAKLDGSDPENIPTPSVGNFTLNVDSRKLYWISPGNVLNRSDLNGAGVESHTYASGSLKTLEAFGDDLFFGAGGLLPKGIWRADADGSNEQFLHSSGEPFDLAYDPVENKLYCGTISAIFRINPDGTGFELVLELKADQVVVDSRARKLYWAVHFEKVIQRSNLDGSNVEDFATASDVGNSNFDILGLTIVYGEHVPGACCDGDPFAPCRDDAIASSCQCAGCKWYKLLTCAEVDCTPGTIPTVSAWGLTVLTLLLMIGAKIAFARPVAVSRVTHGG